MQAAVIFVAGNVSLDWLTSRIAIPGRLYYRSDEEWAVERDQRWAVVGSYDALWDEFDEDELQRVEQLLPSYSGFLLRFSHVEFALEVLWCLREAQAVVDNDHGVIAPIGTFLDQPGWESKWYTRET